MIKISEDQITNKLFLFAYLRREDIFEKEMCNSCINGESKKDPSSCTCNKEVIFLIPDFKLYERYLTGQIITEIKYFLEPYTRYVYVLNQKDEILRVFDMDQIERKEYKNYDVFDISINYHLSNNIIISYLYFNFKLMNNTIEDFFDEHFFELLDEKLYEDILKSDYSDRIEKISILYPWKNHIHNLKKLISNNKKLFEIFEDFSSYLENL